ncbi:MAG: hypothetical protein RBU30_05895 [Polyangia bacterium]|nr:hypothetical protein [Polyangia bacterium]
MRAPTRLVLHAFLPDMPPRVLSAELRAGSEPTRPVGTLLAWELAGRASQALAESSRLALERSSGELGPAARSLALAALGRNMAAHLTTGPGGRPQVAFLVMGEGFTDSLLSLPLFATLGGDSVSMEELASRIERNHGLAYGVIPEVPPALDGLDQQEILSLDEATESRLLGLVGDSVYVRVDRREVLAEHRGLLCRDLALGLRPYPSFPLLVEGVDPSTWPHEEQSAALGILLDQLVRCVTGLATSCGPERHPVGEEERRQACRHLQWFVCKRALAIRAGEQIPGFGVERLPLFLDPEDRAWSFYEVERALQRPEGLTLSLRRALGASELGLLVAAASDLEAAKDQDPSSAPSSLTVSPFVASLLAPLGSLRYALDHPLPGAATSRPGPGSNPGLDRAPEARYLCQLEVRGNGFSGQAGIPAEPSIKGEVSLIEGKSDRLHALPELSTSFGMIALVRLDSAGPMDGISLAQVEMSLRKTGEGLMDGLLELLPDLHPDGPDHLSAALRLLSFAAGQLQLVAAPDGQVRFSSPLGLPARVLDLPLFPGTSGVLLSARSLLERFCRSGGDAPPLDLVAKEAPEALRAWIGRFLQPARVLRLASARPPVVPSDQPRAEHPEDALLAVSVERWLHALRPDLDTPDSMGAKVAQFRVVARRSEVFSRFTNPRELISYTSFDRQPTLILNGDHWLFAHARERGGADPRALAALLLGCYAHVNAALDPISNEHERIFQRRLIEALESGALGAEAGPEPPRDAPEEAPWQ